MLDLQFISDHLEQVVENCKNRGIAVDLDAFLRLKARRGELVAQGATPEEAVAEIGMVVEGLTTAPVLRDLSHRLGVEMPITEGVCTVLGGVPLGDLLATLMQRDPTSE